MSDPVKTRPYASPRREARTRATRARVILAARELFVANGYAATSVDAIGAAADVPMATVYRLFGGKRGILVEVLNVLAVGDDEPVALHDRPEVRALRDEPDPRRFLAGFAHVARGVLDRTGPLQQVVRSAAVVDPEAAEILAKIDRERAAGQANVARGLAERGALPTGMSETEVLDVIYTLMSPQVYHVLTAERGWDSDRYERWLARTMCSTLLRDCDSSN
jgi:AcrR family transcriptional regulator